MDDQYEYIKRRDLVFGLTRLSLWYIYYQTRQGELFDEILNCRTPVYRLTTLWDGVHHPAKPGFPAEKKSEWEQLTDSLLQFYLQVNHDAKCFEKTGFDLLRPYIEGRIEKDIADWPWIPCGYVPYKLPTEQVFGIFAYELKSSHNESLSFHIANSCLPKSPFADMKARARELLRMIRDIRTRIPAATSIGCNSWLNSFPPFLQLFPSSYPQDDTTIGTISYGFNWWGQFMSRDGSLHKRHEKQMRCTGRFPFLSRNGRCSINMLEEWLTDSLTITEE